MEHSGHYGLKKPGLEDFYDVQDQNENMDIIDEALAVKPDAHVVAVRERDPAKPDYGLGGGAAVTLRAGPYTGTAEIALQVEEEQYDAENMSAKPQAAPSGTIIIRKVED